MDLARFSKLVLTHLVEEGRPACEATAWRLC